MAAVAASQPEKSGEICRSDLRTAVPTAKFLDMDTAAASTTFSDEANVAFVLVCRSAMTAAEVTQFDNAVARQANRIAADQGVSAAAAARQAVAQVADHFRRAVMAAAG